MNHTILIQPVKIENAAEILEIYKPYILNTAVTYEETVPSLEDFRQRIESISAVYPYLTASDQTGILGYTYASHFRTRSAYRYSVETTIYLRPDSKGKGIGSALYSRLEQLLKAQGILNLNACISHTPRENDPHLTNASEAFHRHLGYITVGTFHQSGYKFNLWYDSLWMEKMIGPHPIPAPVLSSSREPR